MTYVTAVTGISGVGKSTFLRKLNETLDFQYLQASELIRAGRQAGAEVLTLDRLRDLNLDENQLLLVEGFNRRIDIAAHLAILDSHTLIEQENGLTLIPSDVFRGIGIRSMIFLSDDPDAVSARRLQDTNRQRLTKSVSDLLWVQEAARKQAAHICQTLKIPLSVFSPSEHETVADLLRSYLTA